MNLQYIPARLVRFASEPPAAHCSVRQVKALLRGQMKQIASQFQGGDGSLTEWEADLREILIPEVTGMVVQRINQPLDWCRTIAFFDGPSGWDLTLNHRYVYDVNLCYMRVLPSLPFYAFQRIRNVDGSEFARILGVEPEPPKPEIIPPLPVTAQYASSLIYTGVEDADLFVDTRRRTLTIPPRVLIAGVSLPIANFQFIKGQQNIEVHYRFGFAPTKYEDGSPLQFDNAHPNAQGDFPVINPKPDSEAPSPIDWSSGMPTDFSAKVARLCANKVLRQLWRSTSQGRGSMSVDGASESYGGVAYGGELDREDAQVLTSLENYGTFVL